MENTQHDGKDHQPEGEPEVSSGGSVLYRHTRAVPREIAVGDSEIIEAVSAHIEKHIGPVEKVWHEIVSELVHLDVHHVKPSVDRPYHTLVTSGMSQAPMSVPEGYPMAYAELLCVLPAEWPMTQEAFKDPRVFWPIQALKRSARLPHEFDTWLGPGHTIPNGDPAEPYAPGIPHTGVMITWPLILSPETSVIDIGAGRQAQLLMMVPLTDAEMNYKLQKGSDALEELIDKSQMTPWDLFRSDRPSLVGRSMTKKNWWWPF